MLRDWRIQELQISGIGSSARNDLGDGDLGYSKESVEMMQLSPRERQIAQLVLEGLPNKSIAYSLKISQATVNTYMRRIYLKLDVNNRAQMAVKAIRNQLI
jgi:DNA-binding CsgD family transcriptional regulator